MSAAPEYTDATNRLGHDAVLVDGLETRCDLVFYDDCASAAL